MATLTFLDASDPPPSRDDPHFRDDYAAYRKVYKAWHERERTRRKIAQPQRGAASDAATQHAATQQAEATPVKRRRMLPRPRRVDFDTEEDFEDAMAERGAARDLRRREARAQAEADRRDRLRSGEHAAEVADREADRKCGARRLAAALAEAQKPKSDAARIDPAVRRRLYKQQDLVFTLEELLEPWARCYFENVWFDTHLFGAVVAWAHQHEPDGSDAWEDELIAVAANGVRRRFADRWQYRVGAKECLESAFSARNDGRLLGFTRWTPASWSPDTYLLGPIRGCPMPILRRAELGYCVCGIDPGRHYEGLGSAVPFCTVHNKPAW